MTVLPVVALFASLTLAACGDKDSDDSGPTGAAGCAGLCTDASYSGGTEEDYGDVIECVCEGSGDGLSQEACAAYCSDFGISAENSLLSTHLEPDDKCVCDGTAG